MNIHPHLHVMLAVRAIIPLVFRLLHVYHVLLIARISYGGPWQSMPRIISYICSIGFISMVEMHEAVALRYATISHGRIQVMLILILHVHGRHLTCQCIVVDILSMEG